MINDFDMVLVGLGEEFEKNPDAPKALNLLKDKLQGKNYFIVSLCMDDGVYDAGFDEGRVVSPLGGKRKKQCPDACTTDLYDISESTCPNCGKELVFNNILSENYVEEGYLPMWEKHKLWITGTMKRKLLILELGASMKFPQIVRFPFEKLAFWNEKAHLIRVNEKLPQLSAEISSKGESIKMNSASWVIENINSL